MAPTPGKSSVKVYGWTGWRPGYGQTREVVAAKSAAEVRRIADLDAATVRHSLSVTANETECELARLAPGRVYWRPLYVAQDIRRVWNADGPAEARPS
jgi:hypothetical protein